MPEEISKTERSDRSPFKATQELYELLGTPHFAPSDDPGLFQTVIDRLLEEVRPIGFLESLLAVELIDATWQELSLRHVREAMKAQSRGSAVEVLLFRHYLQESDEESSVRAATKAEYKAWRKGGEDRIRIEACLNKDSGGDDNAILVQTNISNSSNLEWVERAIVAAQRRRMSLLRDLDYCRDRKKAIRAASDNIVKLPAPKSAAE